VNRPELRALADRLGIVAAYEEAGSGARRETSDATRVALLSAMGIAADSEAEAARARRALERERDAQLVAPSCVAPAGSDGARRLALRWPEAARARITWRVEHRAEDGASRVAEGMGRVRSDGGLVLSLPFAPQTGVHAWRVVVSGPPGVREAQQRRIVVPARCTTAPERLGRRRVFGLCANLYATRRRPDAGVGDLSTLRRLVALARAEGAGFVGINPLHAIWSQGSSVSPYQPVSRLYRAALYVDVEAVPELRFAPEARALLASRSFRAELARRDEARHIDYEGVTRAKLAVLQHLHQRFAASVRGGRTQRARAYARYLAREGEPLTRFATFLALAAARGGGPAGGCWPRWPAALRDPRSAAVAAFQRSHPEEVDFHRFVQFELDRQLAGAGRAARALGLGLYGDLAVGSPPDSADAWAFPGLFAEDARVGAPPDDFAAGGQDWGLAPIDPRRLAENGYEFWIRLLRASFAHAGALRMDHVMGLVRLWWVPPGADPSKGAYVRQPAAALLGILALVSRRAGALVIGEDLGTVPPGFAAQLARRGILSSRVLAFEHRAHRYRPAPRYLRRALVTANTHDLAPLAALLDEEDLRLRRRAGHIADDAGLDAERERRRRERRGLLRRLARDGHLELAAPAGNPPGPAALAAAVTAFLCATPAPLVGLSVDDLVGETEPVNLPGVPQERHASWSRRLAVPVEDLARHPTARASLDAVPRARRARGVRRSRCPDRSRGR
jgi:4-alpha-glucanotransferase